MKIIRYQDARGVIGHAALQPDGTALRLSGDVYHQPAVTAVPADVRKLLAPIVPTVFFCIGLNYRKHAVESESPIPEHPIVFMKNPPAAQNPGDPILLPRFLKSTWVDYEGELAVIIGRTCKNVTRERALDYVLGYACANDISARDWQGKWSGGQWCKGKTFDTFAPFGPCLVTADEIPDPNTMRIRTILNGQVRQDSNTADMIFDVPALIAFLSGSTTLLPGTVIFSGTPGGVGSAMKPQSWLQPGDQITVEIEKIGSLTNPIQEEPL